MKINILTNNSCPNSRAFNCPLILSKRLFADKNISLSWFYKINEKLYESDVLFINSNVFREYWTKNKDFIFKTLEKARGGNQKIIWFDTTDSTWCTQFEVLPYVDLFLKSQIFIDKKLYLRKYRTGRIFTDYFDDLYNSGEEDYSYSLPDEKLLDKIDISWNTCFENYTQNRYGIPARIKQKLRPLLSSVFTEKLNVEFTPFSNQRNIDISCRVGLSHSRISVIDHRKAIVNQVQERGVKCNKISLSEYYDEIKKSKIAIGPFGVGEITLRDFEIIIGGAVLMKPQMNHLQTWPDLFQPEETYMPFEWDLSDFNEKSDMLLSNIELCKEISEKAQNIYNDMLFGSGMENFVNRLLDKIQL